MKKALRRANLLAAARKCFATRGYHNTRVDDIVTEAAVAKGTFYLYFADKRSVFEELVDTLFARIHGAILSVDVAADVPAQVRHNIRAVLGVLLDDPETSTMLMTHAAGLDPDFATKIGSFYEGVHTLLRESLLEGQEKGIVATVDPGLCATFIIGALKETLLTMHERQDKAQRERVSEGLYRLFQTGFLRTEPEQAPPSPQP